MRKKDSHKGENGKLLLVAGSYDFSGACFLTTASALGAMRTGVDLVNLAAPEKLAWHVNTLNWDIITHKLKGNYLTLTHYNTLKKLVSQNDCILMGPGAGKRKTTFSLFEKFSKTSKPKVIDADAIKALRLQDVKNSLLTPHHGELEIMLNNSGIKINDYSELTGYCKSNVILLKGKEDLIISSKGVKKNKTGNPGMTVGGTGDVLSGVVAGFLARGMTPERAAYNGAFLVGKIGDELKKSYGYGFIASDFLSIIAKKAKQLI
ncbi:MAG: NAD(P)H-hydrate dehydratase [Nanobdellota archaeon]